jgi:1-acyl-sn-glycerol-3-phosphate acyltransferase
MAETAPPPAPPGAAAAGEEVVLRIVRELAGELGGDRARRAVALHASLERDIGLGSLERVELILRIESAVGRRLEDSALALETPAELAAVIAREAPALADDRASLSPTMVAASPLDAAGATVHEALWRRSEREADRLHAYVREDDGDERELTYGRLLAGAAGVAGGLRQKGVRKGDTVGLMLPTGFDFLRSFQGILLAGAIPVPIYPPARLDRLQEYALRQSAILADAGVKVLVTVERAAPVAALLRPSAPSLTLVTTADELAALGASWEAPSGAGSDPAFIQYTSGSTGHPKGVLLTHDNLLANIRAIARGVEVRPTDAGVSWLPLYHDMGLIGSWLFCLVQGLPISILSPLAFLSRPERWLWTIDRRRATLSAAPNFAYELCARKIRDEAIEGLNLSSWRCALNGAEPVNPATLERFAGRFARYGFRSDAMMPVYGLAESSVALCFPAVGRKPRIDRVARRAFEREGRAEAAGPGDESPLTFVGVGAALPEHEVRVLDDAGRDVPERTVGRLAFRGPSVTSGYFRQAEATRAITLPGGWLDSGDLAYVATGEVFIAGRRKDLIIKAGRNLVPQEIEEVASSVDGVRRGCVVAFGVVDENQATERLVVVAESRARDDESRNRIAGAITDRVASAIGVPPDHVVVAPPGAVAKTSSGKVRRNATREAYEAGRIGRRAGTTAAQGLRLGAGILMTRARHALKATGRGAYGAYLASVVGLLALVLCPLAFVLPGTRMARRLERAAARVGLRLAGCRLSAEGVEHLGGADPLLIVSNHTSYLDVAVLLALIPRDFVFVAKREVLRWPLVGLFVRRARHITVDRSSAHDGVATAAKVAAAIDAGDSVLLFPEATFTSEPGLRPFRLGAFKTAAETGAPIVPVAVRGVRKVLPDGSILPKPGPVHVWVGERLDSAGSDWRRTVALRDAAAEAIAAHSGEPRLDLVAAGPERS